MDKYRPIKEPVEINDVFDNGLREKSYLEFKPRHIKKARWFAAPYTIKIKKRKLIKTDSLWE